MHPARPLLAALAMALLLPQAAAQSCPTWSPTVLLQSGQTVVPQGAGFSVAVAMSGVVAPIGGYQIEVAFDPAVIQATNITQGPYMTFNTFLTTLTVFPDKVRIGGLNFPVGGMIPPPPPIGTGGGVVANIAFQAVGAGPISLDVTPWSVVSTVSGSCSFPVLRQDLVLQSAAAGDILSINGNPDPGGSISLDLLATSQAGNAAITAGSLLNSPGLLLPGFGIVPLNQDFVFNLAIANQPPFTNTVNTITPSGTASTGFAIPPVPTLAGLRVYFASVIIGPSGLVISNSTWLDILAP